MRSITGGAYAAVLGIAGLPGRGAPLPLSLVSPESGPDAVPRHSSGSAPRGETALNAPHGADGGDVFNNPSEVAKYIEEEGVEFIDIRFCDLPGIMQHFNIPASTFDE